MILNVQCREFTICQGHFDLVSLTVVRVFRDRGGISGPRSNKCIAPCSGHDRLGGGKQGDGDREPVNHLVESKVTKNNVFCVRGSTVCVFVLYGTVLVRYRYFGIK